MHGSLPGVALVCVHKTATKEKSSDALTGALPFVGPWVSCRTPRAQECLEPQPRSSGIKEEIDERGGPPGQLQADETVTGCVAIAGNCELNEGLRRRHLRMGANLETAMVAKQPSQNAEQSVEHTKKPQEANLGQKEAGQEKEKKSELSSMGEKSRESQPGSQQK
jgi:hypothetical protein